MLFNYNCEHFFCMPPIVDDSFVWTLLQAYENNNYIEKDLHWANKALVLKLYQR